MDKFCLSKNPSQCLLQVISNTVHQAAKSQYNVAGRFNTMI